jgi:hypothetical protein
MIKKFKIPYNTLTKESILTMIMNYEKNAKVGKVEQGFLKNKTARKKNKEKENLYSEKINKRSRRGLREKESFNNIYLPNKRRSTRAQRAKKKKDYEDSIYEFGTSNYNLTIGSSRKKEYEQDVEYISSLNNIENNGEEEVVNDNGDNGDNGSNLNIIIDKSILFNNYVKEEEEKSRLQSGVPSAEKTEKKQEFVFDNVYNVPVYNNLKDLETNNYLLFNKYPFDYYSVDYHQPIVSPINFRTQIFPMSTKNHFNIDMMVQPYDYSNIQRTYLRSPVCVDKYINKEINMQNKILINDEHNGEKFKAEDLFVTTDDNESKEVESKDVNELERKPSRSKRLSLDIDVVNKTDTNQFFATSTGNGYNCEEAAKENPVIAVTPAESSTTGIGTVTPKGEQSTNADDGKKLLQTSPNNIRTDFSVSPKSAFRMRK